MASEKCTLRQTKNWNAELWVVDMESGSRCSPKEFWETAFSLVGVNIEPQHFNINNTMMLGTQVLKHRIPQKGCTHNNNPVRCYVKMEGSSKVDKSLQHTPNNSHLCIYFNLQSTQTHQDIKKLQVHCLMLPRIRVSMLLNHFFWTYKFQVKFISGRLLLFWIVQT